MGGNGRAALVMLDERASKAALARAGVAVPKGVEADSCRRFFH